MYVWVGDDLDDGVDGGVEGLAAEHAVLVLVAQGVEDQLEHGLHVVRREAKLGPAAHALEGLLPDLGGQVRVQQALEQPQH